MPTWRGVEEFLAVVQGGSFTAGAETLNVSKSFVSKTISELEARIGAQLIVRTTRRLSLTAAGELFYQRCQEMHGELVELEREISLFQDRPKGRLRIGINATFGVDFLSARVAEFTALYPEVLVELIGYLRESDLPPEEFDVVIRNGPLPDSTLKARLFGYLSYSLCASPDYIERMGWPENMDDLARHSCVADVAGNFMFNEPDGSPRSVRVSGNWRSNSGIALAWAARRGHGLAQLPLAAIREHVAEGALVVLESDWAFFDREVWAVFSPGIMAASTRLFIDFLVESFGVRNRSRPWSRILNPGDQFPLVDRGLPAVD